MATADDCCVTSALTDSVTYGVCDHIPGATDNPCQYGRPALRYCGQSGLCDSVSHGLTHFPTGCDRRQHQASSLTTVGHAELGLAESAKQSAVSHTHWAFTDTRTLLVPCLANAIRRVEPELGSAGDRAS